MASDNRGNSDQAGHAARDARPAPHRRAPWLCKPRIASLLLVVLVMPAQYVLLELTQHAGWPKQMSNFAVAGLVVLAMALLDAVAFLVWAMLRSRTTALLVLPAVQAFVSLLLVLGSSFMPLLQS